MDRKEMRKEEVKDYLLNWGMAFAFILFLFLLVLFIGILAKVVVVSYTVIF